MLIVVIVVSACFATRRRSVGYVLVEQAFGAQYELGKVLGRGASLGELTVSRVGEEHVLTLQPKCLDANGHCGQWRDLGECERNPGYMAAKCPRSCSKCAPWD